MIQESTNYVSLFVSVEVQPDRIEEFLNVMKADVIGSMNNENGGCLQFDVIRDLESPNKFNFYEVYINNDALTHHKNTPHFKLWSDFKSSGGVVSITAQVGSSVFYSK